MKKQIAVVAVGVVFSMANAFVSMYLGMKAGFSDGIAVLLLFAAFIIFTALGIRARSKSLICISAILMGSTGVAVSYTDGLGAIIMSGRPFAVPDVFGSVNIGLSASPMMAGIGILIGWRACGMIAAGALGSLLAFIFLETPGTDYSAHMRSPWIFSTAISMMVTTALITMYFVLKPAVVSLLKRQRENRELAADGGIAGLSLTSVNPRHAALVAAIALAAILMAVYPGVPAWAFLICIPIAILFMVIETRGKGEMGMSVGISSFVILLIVGLAFDDIVPLLVLEGFIVAMILTFALMFTVLKQSEFCGIDTKGMTAMALIGVATGAVICVPFMRFFNALFGIGTPSLPAPFSVMWLEMANSAVARVMSPSIDLYMVLAGIAIALALYRYKISAVTMAIGLMLPVSTSAAIIVGGIIAWAIEKKGYLKDDNGITASGLMTGDIIVSIISSLRYL
jgi:hypothetical protein